MTGASASTVHGHVADGYDDLAAAFAQVVAAHPGGAALAVYADGEEKLNLTGGVAARTGRPFGADALVMTASCTKGMTALCALHLAQRGLLDLDAPVAEYWPEFAANGKAHVPVRWLLTHQAGLPVLDPAARLRTVDLLDWDLVTATLAAQEPMWEPGRYCGYHALTFGFLVGEVVRRVAGRTVGTYLREQITGPVGADFHIGLPSELEPRVVPNHVPAGGDAPPDLRTLFTEHGVDTSTPLARAMLDPGDVDDGPGGELWNSAPFHAAEIPAANGIGSAAALARVYAAVIGEVDGVRLLSTKSVHAARTPMTDDVDTPPEFAAITTRPPRFGLGFQLPRPEIDAMLGEGSFGHTGAGGRLGFAHPESGVSFGFTCDAMLWDGLTGPDPRWTPLFAALARLVAR